MARFLHLAWQGGGSYTITPINDDTVVDLCSRLSSHCTR